MRPQFTTLNRNATLCIAMLSAFRTSAQNSADDLEKQAQQLEQQAQELRSQAQTLRTMSSEPQRISNAIIVDFAPLLTGTNSGGWGIGAGFETSPLRWLSIVNSAAFMEYDMPDKGSILSVAYTLRARGYPLSSAVDKLFAGMLYNYTFLHGRVNDKNNGNVWSFGLEAGWKMLLPDNFFVEAAIGYYIRTSPDVALSATLPKPNNLHYEAALGWAF